MKDMNKDRGETMYRKQVTWEESGGRWARIMIFVRIIILIIFLVATVPVFLTLNYLGILIIAAIIGLVVLSIYILLRK